MAVDNFIPTIWTARLLANLNNVHVYTQAGVINRDYDGEIQQAGDTVKINSIGRITISDYVKNVDINAPEQVNDASQILTVNQKKYFNFQVDDVDQAQTRPQVIDAAMLEAAWGLSDASDQFVAGMYTDIAANNWIGSDASPVSVTVASTAYEYLVDLGTRLTENNVPTVGRWAIIPPWYYGLLLKDDRFVKFGTLAQDAVLRNGIVGEAAGFQILQSNNVPNVTGTKYKIMAGHPIAWSYVEQILKMEAYRPEKRFGDAMKGLMVYGAKVTRPTALAVLDANKT
jgi:hypothetical protein